MALHRNSFVQALIEEPDDPIRSQYAPSFLAAVRASKNILQSVEKQLQFQRVILCRFWTVWTYTFSAAVWSTKCSWRARSSYHLLGRFCLYCNTWSAFAPRERCHDRARERMRINRGGCERKSPRCQSPSMCLIVREPYNSSFNGPLNRLF